jgi:hypothetical protein
VLHARRRVAATWGVPMESSWGVYASLHGREDFNIAKARGVPNKRRREEDSVAGTAHIPSPPPPPRTEWHGHLPAFPSSRRRM